MVFREYATKDVIVTWNTEFHVNNLSKTKSCGKFLPTRPDVTMCVSGMSTPFEISPFPAYAEVKADRRRSYNATVPTKPSEAGLLVNDLKQHEDAVKVVRGLLKEGNGARWTADISTAVRDVFDKHFNKAAVVWIAYALCGDALALMKSGSTSSADKYCIGNCGGINKKECVAKLVEMECCPPLFSTLLSFIDEWAASAEYPGELPTGGRMLPPPAPVLPKPVPVSGVIDSSMVAVLLQGMNTLIARVGTDSAVQAEQMKAFSEFAKSFKGDGKDQADDVQVKPDATEAFLKKTLAQMEAYIYVDPMVFCDAYQEKIRQSQFGGSTRSARGADVWVHRDELEVVRIKTHADLDPTKFGVGVLRMMSIWASSNVLRHRVGPALKFFAEVATYPLGDAFQKIRYIKNFMFTYAGEQYSDWPAFMSSDQIMLTKFLHQPNQQGPRGRGRQGNQGGDPPRENRRDTRRKSPQVVKVPNKRQKTQGKRNLKCRSRTDINSNPGGCPYEQTADGCRFSTDGGHDCVSCGGDHTAGDCKRAGTWDQRKADAFLQR